MKLEGVQCTATAKGTGERCRRRVIGGGVCPMHGGRAPQVAAAREARIIEQRARLAGSKDFEVRDPAEALMAAAEDADLVLQRIKSEIQSGAVSSTQLEALGEWLDRVARLSKLIVDARIDERRVRLQEREADLLEVGLRWWLDAVGLAGDQRAGRLLHVMLCALGEGRVPTEREALAIEAGGGAA
jgi:hypothetical protein